MKLVYGECDEGFCVFEDPRFGFSDVRIGRGATIEDAKQDFFKNCREYADKLRAQADNIYAATADDVEHEMRAEE